MFKVRLPGMVFLLLLTLILILTGCTSPGEGEGAALDQLPPEEGEGEPAETNSEEPAESGTVPPGPREGQAAPDFTLSDPEGETYSLADFHGQVVALTFWNSGCRYCLWELSLLDTLQREEEGEVVVLVVNIGDSAATVAELWEQEGYETIALLDDGTIAAEYLVWPIPDNLIIDDQGVITFRSPGLLPLEELRRAVAEARE
jgi:thiol-disulfide isomerase/thioredoxin